MKQINFRIDEDQYEVIKQLAEATHHSIAELAKLLIFEKTSTLRIDIALELYKKGAIGLKRAWKLSGLTPFEFRQTLIQRGVEPPTNEIVEEKALQIALSLNLQEFLRK